MQAHKYHDLVRLEEDVSPVQTKRVDERHLRKEAPGRSAAKPSLDSGSPLSAQKAQNIRWKWQAPVLEIAALSVAEAVLRTH